MKHRDIKRKLDMKLLSAFFDALTDELSPEVTVLVICLVMFSLGTFAGCLIAELSR